MTEIKQHHATDLPTVDLSECENEPIHLLELVQGHGCVLVLAGSPAQVLQASENTDRFLGRTCADVLGQPISSLLDALAVTVLENAMVPQEGHRGGQQHSTGQPVGFYARAPMPGHRERQHLRGTAHPIVYGEEPRLILELEPCPETDEDDAERTFEAEGFAMASLSEGENLYQLLDQAVHAFSGMTDYDRVMAYMFHPDWSGEVVAESRNPDLTPFLGLRYPASDIPPQARELYTRNLLRVIADVNGVSVPMVRSPTAANEEPLDLSQTILRSVSSYHIEYLRNMGVGATLVVSLMVDGALWGLIACHHNSPKLVPWHYRDAIGRLTSVVSERISDILSLRQTRQRRRNQRFIELSDGTRTAQGGLLDLLFFGAPRLADVIRCDGLAISAPGRTTATGSTPAPGIIPTVMERAAAHAETGVFVCNDLGASGLFDDLKMPGCHGALVAIASLDPLIALACFRDEVIHEVHWGGDPNKAVELDSASQRLSPRKSFNLWRQEVRGQSSPWDGASVDLMRHLAEALARNMNDADNGGAVMATAIEALMAGFEGRAASMIEGLGLADNGAILAVPSPVRPDGSDGPLDWCGEIVVTANTAFCNRFDVDDSDIAGRPVSDVLSAMGLPMAIISLPQGGTLEVEWWSGAAGHRTLQVTRRGLFSLARDGQELSWVVFTFDDVTNVYRTQRALGVARSQAMARSRGRTEFLGQLARDLRGPLHTIQSFADSLETTEPPAILDRFRDYAGEIRSLSGNLLDLLNELLDVARLDGSGSMGSSAQFDLTLMVGDVCQTLKESGVNQNVSWDWHLPNERILIQGDVAALRHALSTLISAALRASPPNGAVRVRLTMERGGEPHISISDSGLGLGEDDLLALQRPLDASLSTGRGTIDPRRGLGLSLVRGLIDLHGGGVTVTTNPSSGTTVHVTLPRHRVVERDNGT